MTIDEMARADRLESGRRFGTNKGFETAESSIFVMEVQHFHLFYLAYHPPGQWEALEESNSSRPYRHERWGTIFT